MTWGSALHTQTVVVQLRTVGEPDADGVPQVTTRPVTLAACNVQPEATSQTQDDSRQVSTRYRVSAPGTGHGLPDGPPPGTTEPSAPGSLVIWSRPGTWRIEGDVLEFTGIEHTEFTIVRSRG